MTDVDSKNAIFEKLIFWQYFCSKDTSALNSSLSRLESFVASMAWWATCQGKRRWPFVTCIVATPVFFFFSFFFCLLSTFTSACRQVALFLANKVSIKYIWTWMFSYREPKQPILIRISKKLWEINEWYSLNEYIENITSQPTIWNLFGITNSSSCLMCNCYCSYSCIWGSAREQQCSRTLCTFHLCYKM